MNVTVTKKNESVIYNGKIYSHGQSFDVDDVIGKSLMERGYVSSAEVKDEEELQDAVADSDDLDKMSYPDLKSLAAQLGLDAKGRKDELIERIRAHAEAAPEEHDDLDDSAPEESDELPNTDMPE